MVDRIRRIEQKFELRQGALHSRVAGGVSNGVPRRMDRSENDEMSSSFGERFPELKIRDRK